MKHFSIRKIKERWGEELGKGICAVRENCINKDSMICEGCVRNNVPHEDHFTQDKDIVNNRFRELILSRFSKTN